MELFSRSSRRVVELPGGNYTSGDPGGDNSGRIRLRLLASGSGILALAARSSTMIEELALRMGGRLARTEGGGWVPSQ
jgi:hypothetical protein